MNYFTLDGHSTTEWGIGLSGSSVWDAPARKGESISVPGRNGNIWVDGGSFENILLTYPCWMSEEFDEHVDDFRTFLAIHSDKYYKLSDTYHPDEFRLARYAGPFTADPGTRNKSGRMDIVFDCMPQRFLNAGNEWVQMPVPSESVEGGALIGTIENTTPFATFPIICFSVTNSGSLADCTCKFRFESESGATNSIIISYVVSGHGTYGYHYINTEDLTRRFSRNLVTDWQSIGTNSGPVMITDAEIKLEPGVTTIYDESTGANPVLQTFRIMPRWATI